MIVSLNCRERLVLFVLTQKAPKKSSQQQGFFAAQGLSAANPAKPGLQSFCPCSRMVRRFSKNLLCPAAHSPPLFCRISVEAEPLTERIVEYPFRRLKLQLRSGARLFSSSVMLNAVKHLLRSSGMRLASACYRGRDNVLPDAL